MGSDFRTNQIYRILRHNDVRIIRFAYTRNIAGVLRGILKQHLRFIFFHTDAGTFVIMHPSGKKSRGKRRLPIVHHDWAVFVNRQPGSGLKRLVRRHWHRHGRCRVRSMHRFHRHFYRDYHTKNSILHLSYLYVIVLLTNYTGGKLGGGLISLPKYAGIIT
jgi:hypothetical protein